MVDTRIQSSRLYLCREAWPEKGARQVYIAVLFSHTYHAQLKLFMVMCARKVFEALGPAKWASRAARGRWRLWYKAKVMHMLAVGLLSFTLSWLPLWALSCSPTTSSSVNRSGTWSLSTPSYSFPFAHWLAFFNSSTSPTIHGYFNKNFCHGFQAAFRAWLCPLP